MFVFPAFEKGRNEEDHCSKPASYRCALRLWAHRMIRDVFLRSAVVRSDRRR